MPRPSSFRQKKTLEPPLPRASPRRLPPRRHPPRGSHPMGPFLTPPSLQSGLANTTRTWEMKTRKTRTEGTPALPSRSTRRGTTHRTSPTSSRPGEEFLFPRKLSPYGRRVSTPPPPPFPSTYSLLHPSLPLQSFPPPSSLQLPLTSLYRESLYLLRFPGGLRPSQSSRLAEEYWHPLPPSGL